MTKLTAIVLAAEIAAGVCLLWPAPQSESKPYWHAFNHSWPTTVLRRPGGLHGCGIREVWYRGKWHVCYAMPGVY